MSQEKPIDFLVRPQGTFWLFEPLTERAREHAVVVMDVADWQWIGPAFSVDYRLANDLMLALEEEGFVVGM